MSVFGTNMLGPEIRPAERETTKKHKDKTFRLLKSMSELGTRTMFVLEGANSPSNGDIRVTGSGQTRSVHIIIKLDKLPLPVKGSFTIENASTETDQPKLPEKLEPLDDDCGPVEVKLEGECTPPSSPRPRSLASVPGATFSTCGPVLAGKPLVKPNHKASYVELVKLLETPAETSQEFCLTNNKVKGQTTEDATVIVLDRASQQIRAPKNPGEFLCDICGKQYLSEYTLKTHQLDHGADILKCPHCAVEFPGPTARRKHRKKDCAGRPKRKKAKPQKPPPTDGALCLVCGKLFGKVSSLKDHRRNEHGLFAHAGFPSDPKRRSCKTNLLRCTLCRYVTYDHTILEGHINRHKGSKPFGCEHCKAAFCSQNQLLTHKKQKHDSSSAVETCGECGKTVKNKTALYKHSQNHKKSTCNICGRVFSTRSLREHVRRVHLGEKRQERRYPCEECNYSATNSSVLAAHLLTHRKDCHFVCDQCGRKFANPSSLARHKLQHGNKQKHICQICSKSFNQKCTLDRHMNAHKGIKPYKCDVCKVVFSQSYPLTKHWQKKHPDYFKELVASGKYKGRRAAEVV